VADKTAVEMLLAHRAIPVEVQRTLYHQAPAYAAALRANPRLDPELWYTATDAALTRPTPADLITLLDGAQTGWQHATLIHRGLPAFPDSRDLRMALLTQGASRRTLPAAVTVALSVWARTSLAQGDREPIEALLAAVDLDPLSRTLGETLLPHCTSDAALEYLARSPHLSDALVRDTLQSLDRSPWSPDSRRLTAAALHRRPTLYDRAFAERTSTGPRFTDGDRRMIAAAAGSTAAANHPGWSAILAAAPAGAPDPWVRERLLLLANPHTDTATIALAAQSQDPDVAEWHQWRTRTHPGAVTDWSTPQSPEVHRWLADTLTGTHAAKMFRAHPATGTVQGQQHQVAALPPTMLEPGWHDRLAELLNNASLAPHDVGQLLATLAPGQLYNDRPHLFPDLAPAIEAHLARTETPPPAALSRALQHPHQPTLAQPFAEVLYRPHAQQMWCDHLAQALIDEGASAQRWSQVLDGLDQPGWFTGQDLVDSTRPRLTAQAIAAASQAARAARAARAQRPPAPETAPGAADSPYQRTQGIVPGGHSVHRVTRSAVPAVRI